MGIDKYSIALTLLLALAGCQPKQAEQRATPAKSIHEGKPATAMPSQPVTPQGIVKDLFPNAPEKAQSLDCFRSLKPEMSVYAVVQKCGRPDEEIGSGLYVFIYHLQDGSTVGISTPDLARAGSITGVDKKGRTLTIK